jgi:hypothetical protein
MLATAPCENILQERIIFDERMVNINEMDMKTYLDHATEYL